MTNSAPSPEALDPFADRRLYPRVTIALPAFLQADGKRHSVQLLDVSAGGAKLSCAIGLPAGTAIMLDCGTLARTAIVRWQNGEFVGVSFQSELEAREVNAIIDRSTALGARMNLRG